MEQNTDAPSLDVPGDGELDLGYRSGNLFIIDGSPHMHEDHGDPVGTYFQQSLAMYERILRQKLCRNKNDWMGLMIFAVTKSDPDTPNILTLLEFGEVSVEMLKTLLTILENKIPYYASIASDSHYPLPETLLKSLHTFAPLKIKMPTRQVNLVTCLDDPLQDSNEKRHMTRVHAKTFHSIPITLKTVGFGTWDFDLFYKELEMLSTDSTAEPKRTRPADLEGQVMKKQQSLIYINLKISGQVQLKVSLQTFSRKRQPLATIAMNKSTNEPLDNFFHYRKLDDFFDEEAYDRNDDDEDEDYPSTGVRKWQRAGTKDILVNLEEANSIRHLKPKGIEILYFQKMSKIPPWEHIQPAFFLGIPAEASSSEKQLFAVLLMQFEEKKAEAICAATAREDSRTFLYRMWPCPESNGFYFYRLPFEEEVNRTSEDVLFEKYSINRGGRTFEPDRNKLEIMEKVVKKFRIEYSPGIFPSPKLSMQQQYILALALDETSDKTKDFEDFTEPAGEILGENLRKRGLLDKFFEAFPVTIEGEEIPATKVTRVDVESAQRMAMSDEFNKFTVAQLRAILKALGKNSAGLKADLLKKIIEYRNSVK